MSETYLPAARFPEDIDPVLARALERLDVIALQCAELRKLWRLTLLDDDGATSATIEENLLRLQGERDRMVERIEVLRNMLKEAEERDVYAALQEIGEPSLSDGLRTFEAAALFQRELVERLRREGEADDTVNEAERGAALILRVTATARRMLSPADTQTDMNGAL